MIGSATPSNPAGRPSIETNIAVCPSRRIFSACSERDEASISNWSRRARLPSATCFPFTVPVTPLPVTDSNLAAFSIVTFLSVAPSTIAAASGCSLPRSSPAARASIVVSSHGSLALTETSLGFPRVRVPVLSTTSVSTFLSVSIVSAFLKSTPTVAPLPLATIIDIGVARPRAHGQAMINTATALIRAWVSFGSGPTSAQIMNVTIDMPTTVGTKYAATTSARF